MLLYPRWAGAVRTHGADASGPHCAAHPGRWKPPHQGACSYHQGRGPTSRRQGDATLVLDESLLQPCGTRIWTNSLNCGPLSSSDRSASESSMGALRNADSWIPGQTHWVRRLQGKTRGIDIFVKMTVDDEALWTSRPRDRVLIWVEKKKSEWGRRKHLEGFFFLIEGKHPGSVAVSTMKYEVRLLATEASLLNGTTSQLIWM